MLWFFVDVATYTNDGHLLDTIDKALGLVFSILGSHGTMLKEIGAPYSSLYCSIAVVYSFKNPMRSGTYCLLIPPSNDRP